MKPSGYRSAKPGFAIVVGASQWPNLPAFGSKEDQEASKGAFVRTASRLCEYFVDPDGLGLVEDDVLSLFDSAEDVIKQIDRIKLFLANRFAAAEISTRGETATLFIVYVGHGDFLGVSQNYCLLLRDTRDKQRELTSLSVGVLAGVLKECAPDSSRVVIIDACFAAAALAQFQASDLNTVVRRRVDEALEGQQRQGVALLCAASAKHVARLQADLKLTMFGAALLEVLLEGDPEQDGPMSLDQVCTLTRSILSRYGDAPRPELHAPDQSVGNLIHAPLFPNPASANGSGRLRAPDSGPQRYSLRTRNDVSSVPEEVDGRSRRLARRRRGFVLIAVALIIGLLATSLGIHPFLDMDSGLRATLTIFGLIWLAIVPIAVATLQRKPPEELQEDFLEQSLNELADVLREERGMNEESESGASRHE